MTPTHPGDREALIAAIRTVDHPRVGSPEALADPLRAQRHAAAQYARAAQIADTVIALGFRLTPSITERGPDAALGIGSQPAASAVRTPRDSAKGQDSAITSDDERRAWRCFHCDEVFTTHEDALKHFGPNESHECGCKLNATEKGLLGLLRDAQARLDVFLTENDAQTKLFYSLGAEHHTALIRAEQAGYDKGLADGRALHAELERVRK